VEEIVSHLFCSCPFSQQVWKDMSKLLGKDNVWNHKIVEEGLAHWFDNIELKKPLVIPFLSLWGI
jgi:hypothetical protein